jgi:dipeptidyl aminopeptidase/acylaminoacyl peptidase
MQFRQSALAIAVVCFGPFLPVSMILGRGSGTAREDTVMAGIPVRRPAGFVLLVGLIVAFVCPTARAAHELIPRKVLFGNPDRAGLQISPDGTRISFLAPVNGVLNVWVAPADKPEQAKPVTHDTHRGIRMYFWPFTGKHLLYLQDEGGNENFNLFRVDLDSGETKNLTPNKAVRAQVEAVSDRVPNAILVGLNDRDPRFHDVHRIDLLSGEDKLVMENPGKINDDTVAGFVIDNDFRIRFAAAASPDGGVDYYQPGRAAGDGQKVEWQQIDRVPSEDELTTMPHGFSKDGRFIYLSDSRDRDTAALVSIDTSTGDRSVVFEDPKVDVGGVMVHPTEKTIQAVSIDYERQTWKVIDPAIQPDMDYLKTVAAGELNVTGRSLDDNVWTLAYVMDDGPVRYYRYDRKAKHATFLFTNRKDMEDLKLSKMHPVVIKSRDGKDLVSYLTLPREHDKTADSEGAAPQSDGPLPMVLFVHGGPWGRDGWGLNPIHQWLADRGYAVLSVNFRGSTGFGKEFINAGNREWAGTMHDDLVDAVKWAVDQKIAQQDKVAIMGGSYGGYATLVGLTFTPDLFACGVDIVGPSRLVTLLQTIPPYWTAGMAMFKARVGDISTEEGRKFLDSRSPLTYADRIKRPLLIGQGKNDPRVKQAEADQIVKAMQEKKIPVTYVLFPDEGHGFARPANNLAFYAVAEQFLASHLNGRAEPIGAAFSGSTITVPAGAEQTPGLSEALKGLKPK